jgi:hypothetical protein
VADHGLADRDGVGGTLDGTNHLVIGKTRTKNIGVEAHSREYMPLRAALGTDSGIERLPQENTRFGGFQPP